MVAYLNVLRVNFGRADHMAPALVQFSHLVAQVPSEVLVGVLRQIDDVLVQPIDRRLHLAGLVLKDLILAELILQRARIGERTLAAGVVDQTRLKVTYPDLHLSHASLEEHGG